ncbi:unnamed protein product [Ambrosiozyma monospora]|uniref:Unnamed protein product n=1 Tax=Ambrosiozyma monospora TaxID=43982 RepID=A0ACB5T741_AMBMO|nr:unnamed protein product [Ambrosiozyma monospora]
MDTVIRLCREAGYHKLASIIAKKFNQPSIVVDIQLRDLNNSKLAMKYIKGLPIDDLLRVLVDNVKTLLDKLPNESTQLLIEVFTGKYVQDTTFNIEEASIRSSKFEETGSHISGNSKDHPIITSYRQFVSFMKIREPEEGEEPPKPTYLPPRPRIIFQSFVNHPHEFVIFLEACVESYKKFGGNEKDKKDIMITLYEMYLSLSTTASISTLTPTTADDNEESESSKLQNDRDKQAWESKARQLLDQIQLDESWTNSEKTNLLLLSNLGDFNEGEILIRESTDQSSEGFEQDFFRSAVLAQNYEKSLEILQRYGPLEPELYKLALTTYTANEHIFNTIGGEPVILGIINKIEQLKLMTPLELIKQLSLSSGHRSTAATSNSAAEQQPRPNTFIKLGLVKQYLINYIKRQKQDIATNNTLIESYNSECSNLNTQINKLITQDQVINRPRCSSCGGALELPVIHFKCSHSYHEHCLALEGGNGSLSFTVTGVPGSAGSVNGSVNGLAVSSTSRPTSSSTNNNRLKEDALQCPRCSTELDTMTMLTKQHEEIGERNDLFKASLGSSGSGVGSRAFGGAGVSGGVGGGSNDRFKVMMGFFGRGAMQSTRGVYQ